MADDPARFGWCVEHCAARSACPCPKQEPVALTPLPEGERQTLKPGG